MIDRKGYHNVDENGKRHAEGYSEENIEWRRNKVSEFLAHGYTNQVEISRIMQVPATTINRDVKYLKNKAKEDMARFTDMFAFEFQNCFTEINMIQRKAFELSESARYERNKLLALALMKDCLVYKTELLTNSSVVMQASNFIEIKKKKIGQLLEQEGFDGEGDKLGGATPILPYNVTPEDNTEPVEHNEEVNT